MTTQEVANRYYELATQNKWVEIQDGLYHDDVTCREPDHAASKGLAVLTQGKEAVKAKGAARRAMIETLHSRYCSEPIVAGAFFSLVLKSDLTFKNMPRIQTEEIGVFQVRDGKVVSEQFFY